MRPSLQRFIIGTIVGALVLSALYFSHTPYFRIFFVLGAAGFFSSAVWEYYHLARVKGFDPLDTFGVMATVIYVIAVFVGTQVGALSFLPYAALLFILTGAFGYFAVRGVNPIGNLAVSLFGLIYLAIPLSVLVNINYFFPENSAHDGRLWVLYTLAVAKCGDMGAYFSGKAFGRHPFAPYISPKKTWEGALGGLLFGLLASFCFVKFLPLSFLEATFLGAAISILAQFGDLAESILKRDAGVKDSNQLPGLGGALDMVDSLVFTVPLVYIFLLINFKGQTL